MGTSDERILDLIFAKLETIEKDLKSYREESIQKFTTLETEGKINARVSGGVWGLVAGVAMIIVKFIADHLGK
jgi:hypothetical protein